MDPAYYVAAGSLKARTLQLEVHANNMANLGTTGFKPERTFFTVFNKARESSRNLPHTAYVNQGTAIAGQGLVMTQGALKETGRPLDLALEGNGFFTVRVGNDLQVTRDGRFSLGQNGQLETPDGAVLMGKSGLPLRVDPAGPKPVVDPDGNLRQGEILLGQLDIRAFAVAESLPRLGAGRFSPNGQAAAPVQGRVSQGYLEQSGSDMATGLVEMLRLNRLYEMSMKVASTLANDLDARSVNDIAMQR